MGLAVAIGGAALGTSSAAAQPTAVPGRDLLAYPLGLLAESGALPSMLGLGLRNPAATTLPDAVRWQVAIGAMNTPADVGASGQLLGGSGRWRGATITLSLARAGVAGLVRTESDPLTRENDVPYSTSVTSLSVARAVGPHFTLGAALRVHSGQIDATSRMRVAMDAGFVADHLTRLDARIGASTFLFSPGAGADEPPTWLLGGDVRVAGRSDAREVRVGASTEATSQRPSEQFAFASIRFGPWEARGGPVRTVAFGSENIRARLAVAVQYGGYAVGIAREETPSGLAPTYQFILRSLLR
ncbi:MAG: hypothetical protein U9Q74_12385 [Gemmatimonadota bacterium]|nr:hypothetical protein [Gemmatimonadota bacterium]